MVSACSCWLAAPCPAGAALCKKPDSWGAALRASIPLAGSPIPLPAGPLLRRAGCETEGARLLRDICARLPSDPAALGALFDALGGAGNASISTFELLSSGSVAALRDYLQGADLAEEGPERQQALLQRLGGFAAAALPAGSGSSPPLQPLVSKLLAALAASEKFAVQLNPISPPPPSAVLYGGYFRASSMSRECCWAGAGGRVNVLVQGRGRGACTGREHAR